MQRLQLLPLAGLRRGAGARSRGTLSRAAAGAGSGGGGSLPQSGRCAALGIARNPLQRQGALQQVQVRWKHGKKGKKKPESSAGDEPQTLDDIAPMGGTRERMERVLGGLQKELDQLRGGRPSAAMFDHINVEAYGQHVTMASIAQAAMKGANQVVLTTYDPALAPAVAVAIRDSGMSLNPQVEKSQVVVNIPKPSQESREEVAKIAAKQTEKAKIHIRGIRHNVNEQVKASKGLFSEDDVHRKIKDMDALTHEYEAKLVQALDKKKKDIMTV